MASFLQGFNVTVIAYGQTGSGKTYTMGNSLPSTSVLGNSFDRTSLSSDDSSDEEALESLGTDEGLIPRFLHHLFRKLHEAGGKYHLSVSFLEIYGEDIYDLLEEAAPQRLHRRSEALQLREDRKNGVWVQGLTEVSVSNRQEAMEKMRRGSLRRITASTQMNERSSRSHAVFSVKIVQRVSEKTAVDDSLLAKQRISNSRRPSEASTEVAEDDAVTVSKLTFVDLAGSERLKKTLAEGDRMKEGIQINTGLFALGNVINALGDDMRRHGHVPYRSSKLTRLLQDALGGNSRTLFVACVSPADSNASETLNTLQYANRAKNIQNKAVKNINSRSAELTNLKAFNNLLCRELVKAILAGLGEGVFEDVDKLTTTFLANPHVLSSLSKMKQLTAAAGLEMSSDDRFAETQRLVNHLKAHVRELVPRNGCRQVVPLTCLHGNEGDDIKSEGENVDCLSESEFSVAIMEEQTPKSDDAFVTYPLGTLHRTLEVMNCALEMLEIQRAEEQQRESFQAKIAQLETRYHRHELLRDGILSAVRRMQTWLSSSVYQQASQDTREAIDLKVTSAKEKIELMEREMKDIQCQKETLCSELESKVERCQRERKAKHEQLFVLRDSVKRATNDNALNVLTRQTEIKVRCNNYNLESILEYLTEEERKIAASIDENKQAISYVSHLFTKDEPRSSQSREILARIQEQLQLASDKESLETSLDKELRKRTQLFQQILNGLTEYRHDEMTEQEFMEKNAQNLKECEESISHICDASRAKQSQRTSIAEILASIESLDTAKDVIRRLIVELYSQWRLAMVAHEDERLRQQKEAQENVKQKLAAMETAMDARVRHLEVKYEKDVQSILDMVKSFNDAVKLNERWELQSEKAGVMGNVAVADERTKELVDQLAMKDEQILALQTDLERMQVLTKNQERREESYRIMSRCQEIWQELGLNEEYQANQLHQINDLLVQKCSEELESLEAARAKLQARITTTYYNVQRMEVLLQAGDPVDLPSVPTVAGGTLLEQEKYLLALQERLSSELWQHLNARIRTCEGIRELAVSLGIKSIDDFCHVSKEDIGNFDADFFQLQFVELDVWKQFQAAKDSAAALDQFLERCSARDDMSRSARERYDLMYTVMLKEKTNRIAELQEHVSAIRAVARTCQLSQDEIVSVVYSIYDRELSLEGEMENLCALILQTGGKLDVSHQGLDRLATLLRGFKQVHEGRSNALAFLHRVVEEATMVKYDKASSDGLGREASVYDEHFISRLPKVLERSTSFLDTLAAGKDVLEALTERVERSIRGLFYAMNDELAAFGIDTEEQRMGFFLSCKSEARNARRGIVDKYLVQSSRRARDAGDNELRLCTDSFLSRHDPAFREFQWSYSVTFGDMQLERLRTSIADMEEVQRTVASAQIRLQSLQKIMNIFTKINEFKAKIAAFEANASQKDRLFGNSLVLLEEERFRKMAAKHYPSLLVALRKEVTRWLENEDGEFDLSVLGDDLKTLLLEMIHTDTGLMHLNLDTIRRSSKPSVPLDSSRSSPATSTRQQRAATSPAPSTRQPRAATGRARINSRC